MDRFIKRISQRLAEQPSRRGFVFTLGKMALGAALAVTGGSLAETAEATANMRCCTGTPCSTTTSNIGPCPNGWNVGYAWICAGAGGHVSYDCLDCYDFNGGYRCTYVALRSVTRG